MSRDSLVDEVSRLVRLLSRGMPQELGAIPWASPVLAFGNPITSQVATLGLNPSNLEFEDRNGQELVPPHHRLESLKTLQAVHWGQVSLLGADQIWRACEDYFHRNPYDQWFKRLERVLVGTGASYYTSLGDKACHLDLVPFATAKKWSALTVEERALLIELGTFSLARVILTSDIRVLILNGSTVVREFSRLIPDEPLTAYPMAPWALQGGRVGGIAYLGHVNRIGQFRLERELLVMGYNHNIQSSFGVTTEVTSRIASWVGQNAVSALV